MKGVVPGEERMKEINIWFLEKGIEICVNSVFQHFNLVSHRGGGLCAVEGDWG